MLALECAFKNLGSLTIFALETIVAQASSLRSTNSPKKNKSQAGCLSYVVQKISKNWNSFLVGNNFQYDYTPLTSFKVKFIFKYTITGSSSIEQAGHCMSICKQQKSIAFLCL